ncbi:lysyl oxidase homolog 3A isoform X2 [Alosa alosa]|uniref:lysyl oxidase homolog 3A isoform X2 n=1 Tax=Alosa alosa TaxID=278164 RepID=UPI00201555CC|nr:lysyl oxidase homolog 3A isoform X2 [Alosa alosa]
MKGLPAPVDQVKRCGGPTLVALGYTTIPEQPLPPSSSPLAERNSWMKLQSHSPKRLTSATSSLRRFQGHRAHGSLCTEMSRLWGPIVALLLGCWLPSFLCQTTPPAQDGKIKFRLAGYPRKHNEGRVEVLYQGEWGTICDDDFTLANAMVLCRQLGFVSATAWSHSAKYGAGTGKIWLDNVICSGTESSIEKCHSRGWGNSDCTHDEDAGIVCKDERLPGFVDSNIIEMQVDENRLKEVRLRPLSSGAAAKLPINEGVVEVKYKEGWAQICSVGWTVKNSRVVCGMMGFPSEKAGARASHSGSGPYRIHSVSCTGHEVHLSACNMEFVKPNSSYPCAGGGPSVVSCVPGPQFTQSRSQKRKLRLGLLAAKVRLRGGARAGEGRVEVLKGTQWGTVCDDRWNLLSASVVCRELGFGSAKEALTGARMGQGMGPIYMNEVQCSGNERMLWDCPHKTITSEDCNHVEDASVKCNVPYMAFEKTIRLSGGRTRVEGRVEVLAATGNATKAWGLICGDGWTVREAMVVCRQLGLTYASSGLRETWYWDSSNVTEMVLSGVKCTGNEMTLADCRHDRSVSCRRAGAQFSAGVICTDTASDLILNALLVEQSAYIEDRPLHLLYCAAEENCLSKSAARANWPYGHRRLLRFSSQIHNIGRADFRPKLGRHSWVWHECHRHYHSMEVFTNYDLLDLNGTKVADGHKASFCLEDTECQEGVSKRYECANFGEQGITVGCWDVYRHDIDCQWIDITDVKPGNYILQVIINPNFDVAESDFTNNGVRCNCKYDGNRVWLHKCHFGGSFSDEEEKKFEHYPGQHNNQIS